MARNDPGQISSPVTSDRLRNKGNFSYQKAKRPYQFYLKIWDEKIVPNKKIDQQTARGGVMELKQSAVYECWSAKMTWSRRL